MFCGVVFICHQKDLISITVSLVLWHISDSRWVTITLLFNHGINGQLFSAFLKGGWHECRCQIIRVMWNVIFTSSRIPANCVGVFNRAGGTLSGLARAACLNIRPKREDKEIQHCVLMLPWMEIKCEFRDSKQWVEELVSYIPRLYAWAKHYRQNVNSFVMSTSNKASESPALRTILRKRSERKPIVCVESRRKCSNDFTLQRQ